MIWENVYVVHEQEKGEVYIKIEKGVKFSLKVSEGNERDSKWCAKVLIHIKIEFSPTKTF